jgi:hypothetical protein
VLVGIWEKNEGGWMREEGILIVKTTYSVSKEDTECVRVWDGAMEHEYVWLDLVGTGQQLGQVGLEQLVCE